MVRMDTLLEMSFERMRESIVDEPSLLRAPSRDHHSFQPSLVHAPSAQPRLVQLPRGVSQPSELHRVDVHLFPSASDRVDAPGVHALADTQAAIAAAAGKRDFALLEPLDDAVRQRMRIVFVSPREAPSLASAQVHLAESLSRWLAEPKLDGEGRPYGDTKDDDPTTRQKFSPAQIAAIHQHARS